MGKCLLPDSRRANVLELAGLLIPGHREEVQGILQTKVSLHA